MNIHAGPGRNDWQIRKDVELDEVKGRKVLSIHYNAVKKEDVSKEKR